MLRSILLCLVALLGLCAAPAAAQSGANVLVVVNESSADSMRVGEQYARARGIPQDQVLRITADPAKDDVDRETYDRQIQAPVGEWLARHAAHDRILYIVLTKGVPLRIRGTSGRNGTTASVDSELTLLYRRLSGTQSPVQGSIPNPYYLASAALAQAKFFTHADFDIYLVTRLDGFTLGDALGLVERAAHATREGKIVLDAKSGLLDSGGDQWLEAAASWLAGHGFGDRVVLDQTTRVVTGLQNVLGYYSWGSNDPAIRARHLGLGFVPGALAGMFVSTDARTFKEPPAEWKTTNWNDRSTFFAGSPQSLVGDLVRDGVTGVSGNVAEPYLDATVRPNILFPAYFLGFNLAESFYLAMPFLSWQGIVVGDPLCAPFPRKMLQPGDIDKGVDPSTELPALFSARRLRALGAGGGAPEALAAMLRAEARSAKGDKAGARKALEEATSLDPKIASAQLLLGMMYEEQKQHEAALARYRRVLEIAPQNPVALNNLAYSLAVHQKRPAEALPYAERAFALSPTASVADTLAWVQHLLGRDQEAVKLLADAVRALPTQGEIRLHAAVVYASVGMMEAAEKELKEAVRLDQSLGAGPEAAAVREKLKSR